MDNVHSGLNAECIVKEFILKFLGEDVRKEKGIGYDFIGEHLKFEIKSYHNEGNINFHRGQLRKDVLFLFVDFNKRVVRLYTRNDFKGLVKRMYSNDKYNLVVFHIPKRNISLLNMDVYFNFDDFLDL